MAANNRAIQSTISIENGTLTISTDAGNILVTIAELDKTIREHAILHGLKQKIVDAAAMPNGATIAEKFAAMKEVADRLTSDDPSWNKGNSGGSGVSGGLLFRALIRLYPTKTPDAIRAYLDKLDKAKQAALRGTSAIAAMIETIKSEAIKTAGIDTEGLLEGLDEI